MSEKELGEVGKELEEIRKELQQVKLDAITEQINNKLDLLREEVKLFAVSLSMIHSDVCRIMACLGVIETHT